MPIHLPRRRDVLTGIGAAASLPFLSRFASRSVQAQDQGAFAKRLIVFFTPNEPIHPDHWRPNGNGNEFALTGLTPMMASLEPHMADLLMIGGLEMQTRAIETHGAGHVGIGHMLTGRTVSPHGSHAHEFWASGISVDQHIANHLGVDALTLGVRPGTNGGNARISYSAADQPVHPIADPIAAFDSIFADFDVPAAELDALRARRLSVLDKVAGELEALESKVPSEAANKLGVHLDRIRDLETKLSDATPLECSPAAPAGGMDYTANANFPEAARRQMDVMVEAIACGVTDVASLQLSASGGHTLTPLWPGEGININIDAHTMAHDWNKGATQLQQRIEFETLMFDLFAYLLDQLAAVPEGNGRLLDNTLVFWVKNLGVGHNSNQMLFMLGGGAGGALETGRYLEFPGASHNDLLVSVCNLMGMDETTFGDPSLCSGPLPV